jgi:DNA-binding transcriptional LysR family regulator
VNIAILYGNEFAFIRYFLAVAETGGFTAAAERCHVTQTTLSAGIGRLEEEIGAKLFDRSRRAALTAAGQKLLPHARAMVEALAGGPRRAALGQAADAGAGGDRSTLPIQAAMGWLAAAQRRIGFDLEISEGTAAVVMERWRRGRCELAPVPVARADRTATTAWCCCARPMCCAAATDHRVATRDRWAAADLAETPFILRAECEAHDDAQRLLAAAGVRPRAVLRSASEERCAAAVLAGLGVSLHAALAAAPGMAAAEIREVALERRLHAGLAADADPEIAAAIRDAATADDRLGLRAVDCTPQLIHRSLAARGGERGTNSTETQGHVNVCLPTEVESGKFWEARVRLEQEERRQAQEREEADDVGHGGQEHRRGHGGIDAELLQPEWDQGAGKRGGDKIADHRRADHSAKPQSWYHSTTAAPITRAKIMPFSPPTAISLAMKRSALAGVNSPIARARTATVTVWVPALPAHRGDDRHQHGERHDLLDRALELADHQRGDHRGEEVDRQPDASAAAPCARCWRACRRGRRRPS